MPQSTPRSARPPTSCATALMYVRSNWGGRSSLDVSGELSCFRSTRLQEYDGPFDGLPYEQGLRRGVEGH
jgi:hypothetical protein